MDDSKCPCAACIFNRVPTYICRWVRRKWRYRASNMKRLRREQQEINVVAAGTVRDPLQQALDLLDQLMENEDE